MSAAAPSPGKGCPDSRPASCSVPWGGKRGGPVLRLRRLPGWHGYTSFAKGAETLASWHRQRPQPAQAETPGRLLLYLLGPGFSRETRLRASAAAMGALHGRSRGGKQRGREWNRRFLGCWPKGKLHFRSNRRLMPLLMEGWVWSLSYLGKLKSKKKFQNHK